MIEDASGHETVRNSWTGTDDTDGLKLSLHGNRDLLPVSHLFLFAMLWFFHARGSSLMTR